MLKATLTRIWDSERKIGIPLDPRMLPMVAYVFIRKDGWAIGCTLEGYDEVNNLYDWEVVLELK